jgi:gamma-glutamyltranspeptidase/glutathione hydrolase
VTKPKLTSILSPNLSRRRQVTKPSLVSKGGIVVAQNRIAAEVGARVLKAGGHAVDAAVATAFTVGVVEPWMSGIGGVGVMLVYEAKTGKVTGLDFGAVSPIGLDPRDYPIAGGTDGNLFGWPVVKDNRNTTGPHAVTTPSQPLGLATAHKMWGKKRWKDLVAPSVKHAEEGLVVDWNAMLMIAAEAADLARDPGAAKRFLRDGVAPHPPIAALADSTVRLAMPDLARTLAAIGADGVEPFYKGAIAKAIGADIKAMGGSLRAEDLARCQVRVIDQPLRISHGDRTVHLLPELNGGPTAGMAFQELARIRKRPEAKPGAKTFLAYAEALRHAWLYRFAEMGEAGALTLPTCTTHLSVVDRDGNMVTLTQTLLSLFGSRIVLPKTGILMNNGINWFDPRPGGPNSIAPAKRALANYCPAIMTGGGETIAIGGCGGRKILPAVFQLLAMIGDFGLDLNDAFHQPRIDVSGLGPVAVDHRLGAKVTAAIAERFDTVEAEAVPYPMPFTIASAVRRARNVNEGATEPETPWSEAVGEDEV